VTEICEALLYFHIVIAAYVRLYLRRLDRISKVTSGNSVWNYLSYLTIKLIKYAFSYDVTKTVAYFTH